MAVHQGLAGIQPDPLAPGFKNIVIRPAVVGDLAWVKGSYRSIHGTIVSHWRRDKDAFTLNVTIPANTTATVYVPTSSARSVSESGRPASQSDGVRFLRTANGHSVFAVESGKYSFASELNDSPNPAAGLSQTATVSP